MGYIYNNASLCMAAEAAIDSGFGSFESGNVVRQQTKYPVQLAYCPLANQLLMVESGHA